MAINRITARNTGFLFQDRPQQPIQTVVSAGAMSMVVAPFAAVQGTQWQAELYRAAYERAVADLSPPRYLRRFADIWN